MLSAEILPIVLSSKDSYFRNNHYHSNQTKQWVPCSIQITSPVMQMSFNHLPYFFQLPWQIIKIADWHKKYQTESSLPTQATLLSNFIYHFTGFRKEVINFMVNVLLLRTPKCLKKLHMHRPRRSIWPGSRMVGLELNSPVNTIKVMLSPSVYLTKLFLGKLSLLSSWPVTVHILVRNWQLPFLNQQKGENDHSKIFISWSISMKECCPTRWVSNLQSPDHQSDAHPTEPLRLAMFHLKWKQWNLWINM